MDSPTVLVEALLVARDVTTVSLEDCSLIPLLDEHSQKKNNDHRLTNQLSRFEQLFTSYPPLLEALLAHLPTAAILSLYQTSVHLRQFLAAYPLAWNSLSFRLAQATALQAPGNVSPDGRSQRSKPFALDTLLEEMVVPYSTCLRSLDLDNTAVNGETLVSCVLPRTHGTLKHLSVRGCKFVSLKYHLVPYLSRLMRMVARGKRTFALTSLYTYRSRHHRRRPYLPSSLLRRESDSEPTHELIETCHKLGIWTDTAWCPTPGARCFRRRDYYCSRRATLDYTEVWVPFDRLWRSGNRVGTAAGNADAPIMEEKLWESCEQGHDGEALGMEAGTLTGEGKGVPAHMRRSHRTYLEGFECGDCGDPIPERCEQCSVRMHCMGCRKTLCASCAFDKPLPRRQPNVEVTTTTTHPHHADVSTPLRAASDVYSISGSSMVLDTERDRFWWAPGAMRSPNQMRQGNAAHTSSDSESDANTLDVALIGDPNIALSERGAPKLNMHWCCLEPVFSGGGGIAFIGPHLGGPGAELIRASPLPPRAKFLDPDFVTDPSIEPLSLRRSGTPSPYHVVLPGERPDAEISRFCAGVRSPTPLRPVLLASDPPILPFLQQDSIDLCRSTCPRSLCQDCYRGFKWKVSCTGCRLPLCKEHDLGSLKVRKCGFRVLPSERALILDPRLERVDRLTPGTPLSPFLLPPGRLYRSTSHQADPVVDSNNDPDPIPDPHRGRPLHFAPIPNPSIGSVSVSQHLRLDTLDSSSTTYSAERHSHLYPYRPRSISLGGQRPGLNHPLPGHPAHPVQWLGCGAYFCPEGRSVGDARPRCSAVMRCCAECHVYVCPQCLLANPRCTCAKCSQLYLCPVCANKPAARAFCQLAAGLAVSESTNIAASATAGEDAESAPINEMKDDTPPVEDPEAREVHDFEHLPLPSGALPPTSLAASQPAPEAGELDVGLSSISSSISSAEEGTSRHGSQDLLDLSTSNGSTSNGSTSSGNSMPNLTLPHPVPHPLWTAGSTTSPLSPPSATSTSTMATPTPTPATASLTGRLLPITPAQPDPSTTPTAQGFTTRLVPPHPSSAHARAGPSQAAGINVFDDRDIEAAFEEWDGELLAGDGEDGMRAAEA